MQIELNISERLVRKIRALNMLLGGHSSGFEDLLSNLLEESVSQAIAHELGIDQVAPAFSQPSRYVEQEEGSSNLADGLGDLDDEESETPEPVRSMSDVIPRRGGLTDQALLDDMMIGDPEHEAKVDAATFIQEFSADTAESLFAEVAGLPSHQVEDDLRKVRRKKHNVGRGRVTPFNGNEESRL